MRGELGLCLCADLASFCIGTDCHLRWTAEHAVMSRCTLNAAGLAFRSNLRTVLKISTLPAAAADTFCMLQRIRLLERGRGELACLLGLPSANRSSPMHRFWLVTSFSLR